MVTLRHCHFGKPWENNDGKLIKIWVYHIFRQTYIPFLAAQNHDVSQFVGVSTDLLWTTQTIYMCEAVRIKGRLTVLLTFVVLMAKLDRMHCAQTIWSDLAHVSHLEGWGVYLNQGHIYGLHLTSFPSQIFPTETLSSDSPLGTDMRHRRESEGLRLKGAVAGGEKPWAIKLPFGDTTHLWS